MRRNQIEVRALEIIANAKKGNREDAYAEWKRDFVEPEKMARRLAGHANAALGEPICWLIGVDDKTGDVVGASERDLATYWPQVKRHFEDDVVPDIRDVNMVIEDKSVVVLYFETDRSPYLIKNPKGGEIQFEVPWREGTSIRTAKRTELLRILSLQVPIPDSEILNATFHYGQDSLGKATWMVNSTIYFVPKTSEIVALPFHAATCDIFTLGQHITNRPMPNPGAFSSSTIEISNEQIVLRGPGTVSIQSYGSYPAIDLSQDDQIDVTTRFAVAGSGKIVVASHCLSRGVKNVHSAGSLGFQLLWT